MSGNEQPFIPAHEAVPEITTKVIILGILLAIVLAVANAYLALKVGILTAASIPAAIISMGILRFFPRSNILENNLVQTCASAGEAVAGGIVYTLPALIIIRYWYHFPYWESMTIALIGGTLGVLFSIPMRHVLVTEKSLRFPEGRAIAEVLKMTASKAVTIRDLLWAMLVGAVLELAQVGFKLVASAWQAWFVAKRTLFGFGLGFSPAMIGAGYLIGFRVSASIMLGAIICWLISVPVISDIYPQYVHSHPAMTLVVKLWGDKIRYLGIGAMLFAGVWTFLLLLKPMAISIKTAMKAMRSPFDTSANLSRTERDVPLLVVIVAVALLTVAIACWMEAYFPFEKLLPLSAMVLGGGALLYTIIIGFIFSGITGYFSGMVGVSASPGSAVIIAGILLIALLLQFLMSIVIPAPTATQILAAEGITIFIGALITSMAAIANDNIQDLKVGHILGATPWRQELMLILGVVVASVVIPPVMELMFNTYGIVHVMPRAGMDPSQALPAPPAALMAAITQAVFHRDLPWAMVIAGAMLMIGLTLINPLLKKRGKELSILGVAIGIYLPLASSTPIFIGGLIHLMTTRKSESFEPDVRQARAQRGILLACGLIAGAALLNVVLAIPFSLFRDPDLLKLSIWSSTVGIGLAVIATLGLAYWFYRVVCERH